MIVAITIMMVAAALCIIVFTMTNPRATPVLSGQRWKMPGLGNILIVKTVGIGASFGRNVGKHINVKYQLLNGEYGYCTKSEIRNTGRLLPYGLSERDAHIRNILDAARKKSTNKQWSSYSPPPGWVKPQQDGDIRDAEIVNTPRKPRPPGSKLALDDLD